MIVTQPVLKFADVTRFHTALFITAGPPVTVPTLPLQLFCSVSAHTVLQPSVKQMFFAWVPSGPTWLWPKAKPYKAIHSLHIAPTTGSIYTLARWYVCDVTMTVYCFCLAKWESILIAFYVTSDVRKCFFGTIWLVVYNLIFRISVNTAWDINQGLECISDWASGEPAGYSS